MPKNGGFADVRSTLEPHLLERSSVDIASTHNHKDERHCHQ